MAEFANDCMVQIGERSKDAPKNSGASFLDWQPPAIDMVQVVKTLGECIRFADAQTAIRLAAVLYSFQSVQVQARRLVEDSIEDERNRRKYLQDEPGQAHILWISDALIASAELVALNQSLLPYGREDKNKLDERVSRKEIKRILNEAGVRIDWVDGNVMGDGSGPETSEKFEEFLNRPRRR